MASATDFAKFVPGFDFLQGLMRSAGHVLPDMGKWVAPTLDPEELGQRIEQLKTVQVWLEQNARMLGTTVQALEVQRMTLATLKSMNVPVADLGQALQARTSAPADPARATDPPPAADPPPEAGGAAPMVDPMQWWGALTQQFTQLAAQAMKEGPVEAARSAASQFADVAARAAHSAPTGAPRAKTQAPAKAPTKAQAGARGSARKPRTPAGQPARAPRSKQT